MVEIRTRKVRQAYVLCGFELLLGASQLSLVPGSAGWITWLHVATGGLLILVAVAFLTSTRLRHRGPVAGNEPLASSLDAAGKAEIDSLLARGKVILAVRRVREVTGLDLVDAKRLVDSLRR